MILVAFITTVIHKFGDREDILKPLQNECHKVIHCSTNCPKLHRVHEAYANTAHEKRPVALIIGGNKGYDCVGWSRMFSPKTVGISATTWKKQVQKHTSDCGNCYQCNDKDYPQLRWATSSIARVFCIEPMQANLSILKQLMTEKFARWNVHVEKGAIALFPATGGTVPVPKNLPQGYEAAGIGTAHGETENVPAWSIDRYVEEKMSGLVPSVLTIDTEGWDAIALLGAARTLASGKVHYLEFEYHECGKWPEFNLQYIVQYLANLRFDCFWPLGEGLARLTGCWFDEYNKHCWSNVICSREGTLWHSTMISFVKPQP